jgi:acyl-CoA dehydrogenase
MLTLGGYLKKKESISARLGDVLSAMYLASMVLKHHEDQGSPASDLPIVEWSCRSLLYQAQEQLHGVLRNFPVRAMSWLMRRCIFPRGLTYFAPGDRLGSEIAGLAQVAGESRERLAAGIYNERHEHSPLGQLQQALELSPAAEVIEKKLRISGVKMKLIDALDLPGQIEQGLALGIITSSEAAALREYDQMVMDLINVDDFASHELGSSDPGPSAAS